MLLTRQNHIFKSTEDLTDKLCVVTSITNPERFRSRYELYKPFEKQVLDAGADLYTVEVAFGYRPFEITTPDNPKHLQLRTFSEIWHKENSLNLLIERLPPTWKYLAWIDADVTFTRPDWVTETVQQLQHFPIVQMWSQAFDLSPDFEKVAEHESFIQSWIKNGYKVPPDFKKDNYYYGAGKGKKFSWHPGFAWAIRKDAFDALGGLIDFAILGAADNHMALALVGNVLKSAHHGIHPYYKDLLGIWQDRATSYIQQDIGIVPGMIYHGWHGKKVDRRYYDRWRILVNNDYNPKLDLKNDWQGLHQLTDRSPALKREIRNYFRQRNEDSIDVE